ncbi:hypothetical protein CRE_09353 [Caenorhabditis remanei]|uniref:Uncharacterized protein n=1 Tax=Caenorhabditis remanei TaxID=31234 RepID=E3LIC9_CAERE|nr:hypothetical protein CRE_09353 [Caenorhabditis remanei]
MPDSASTKHQSGVFNIPLENDIVLEWKYRRERTADKAISYNSFKILTTIMMMVMFFCWTIRFLELNSFLLQCRLCYIYGFVAALILINLFFERRRIEEEFSAKNQNVKRGYKQRIVSLKEKSRVLDKKECVWETVFIAVCLFFAWTGLAFRYAQNEKENYSAKAALLGLHSVILFVDRISKIVITFADPKDTYWPIQKIWKI